jgi:hypothetical protein
MFKQLETVQNSALRYIQGARRTTPIVSLQVESFIAPLQMRFSYLFNKWVLRYLLMPAEDQVPYMLGFSNRGLHGDTPFVIRAQKSLQKLGLTFSCCAATPLMSPIPPQVDLASNILLNLQDNFFINMPHQLIQNCFSEFLSEHYPKHIQIYTDGSKSDGGSVLAGLFVLSTQLATGWLL